MRPGAWTIIVSGLFLGGCMTAPTHTPPSSGPSSPSPIITSPQAVEPSPPPPFELVRVTPQEVKARMDQGESLRIVDVRGRASYDLLHIEGAISLPAHDYQVWGPPWTRSRPLSSTSSLPIA